MLDRGSWTRLRFQNWSALHRYVVVISGFLALDTERTTWGCLGTSWASSSILKMKVALTGIGFFPWKRKCLCRPIGRKQTVCGLTFSMQVLAAALSWCTEELCSGYGLMPSFAVSVKSRFLFLSWGRSSISLLSWCMAERCLAGTFQLQY